MSSRPTQLQPWAERQGRGEKEEEEGVKEGTHRGFGARRDLSAQRQVREED